MKKKNELEINLEPDAPGIPVYFRLFPTGRRMRRRLAGMGLPEGMIVIKRTVHDAPVVGDHVVIFDYPGTVWNIIAKIGGRMHLTGYRGAEEEAAEDNDPFPTALMCDASIISIEEQ